MTRHEKITGTTAILGILDGLGGIWLTVYQLSQVRVQLAKTEQTLRAGNTYQVQKDARELLLDRLANDQTLAEQIIARLKPIGATHERPTQYAEDLLSERMESRSRPALAPERTVFAEPSVRYRYSQPIAMGKRDAVEFAVSTPLVVRRSVPFLVDAWAYLPQDRETAVGRTREAFGKDAPFRSGGSATVARGAKLKVQLQAEPWSVEPKFQTIVWAGYVTNTSFRVRPDADVPHGTVHAVLKISVRAKRIGEIHFDFTLGEKQAEPTVTAVKRLNIFASYASKDRARVLATVQGIEKFADVFLDVRNLKSGAPYPTRLLQQIDASDVLYLFWSRHAKQSEWVDREWRYGFERRGIDFIDPVPLADPREVPPPTELASEKHFNDWTLAYLEYEKSLGIWERLRSRWGAD